MSNNAAYAVFSASIAAVFCAMFFANAGGPNNQEVEIERIRAQSKIDTAKAEADAQAKRLECVERVTKALGAAEATKGGFGGTESELKRLCK